MTSNRESESVKLDVASGVGNSERASTETISLNRNPTQWSNVIGRVQQFNKEHSVNNAQGGWATDFFLAVIGFALAAFIRDFRLWQFSILTGVAFSFGAACHRFFYVRVEGVASYTRRIGFYLTMTPGYVAMTVSYILLVNAQRQFTIIIVVAQSLQLACGVTCCVTMFRHSDIARVADEVYSISEGAMALLWIAGLWLFYATFEGNRSSVALIGSIVGSVGIALVYFVPLIVGKCTKLPQKVDDSFSRVFHYTYFFTVWMCLGLDIFNPPR